MVDTLRIMGKVARESARTWTMREWASRLATRAPPRDYLAQLRELYKGILKRWRYVQEPGEWIFGRPRSLLGFALGANYNLNAKTCPSPERCDVEATTWKEKGWGDCDDVAALAAAGALAIGMPEVLFRVATWGGGAHVNAVARTPRGKWVSIDPVGHPDHGFGWALDPQGGSVLWFDLDANPVTGPAPAAPANSGGGASMNGEATYMGGLDGIPRRALQRRHVVLTRRGDTRGPRLLTMPGFHHRLFRRGIVYDRTPAVDQFGDAYQYMSGSDVWAPMRGYSPLGRRRRRKRSRFRKRWARRFKKIKKGPIGKAFRAYRKVKGRIKAWILERPLVQNAVGAILQIWGVPLNVTKNVLSHHAKKIRRGGALHILKLALKGKWKLLGRTLLGDAAQFLPKRLRKRLAKRFPKLKTMLLQGFDGQYEEGDADHEWVMEQGGRSYPVAPVSMMMGADNMYEMGQLEVQSTPTPGAYYKIAKGDNLPNIAQRAFGVTGGARLKASQMISNSKYNKRFHRPTKSKFAKKYYGETIVSMYPEWTDDLYAQANPAGARPPKGSYYATIWIPPAANVEPPPLCPPGSEYSEADGRCVVFSPTPVPTPPIDEEEETLPPVVIPDEDEEEDFGPPIVLDPEDDEGAVQPPMPDEDEADPYDPEPPGGCDSMPPKRDAEGNIVGYYATDPNSGDCVFVRPCPHGFRHPNLQELAQGMKPDSCIPGDDYAPTPEEEEEGIVPGPHPQDCPDGMIWSDIEGGCKWIAPGPAPTPEEEEEGGYTPSPFPQPGPTEKKKSILPLLLAAFVIGG